MACLFQVWKGGFPPLVVGASEKNKERLALPSGVNSSMEDLYLCDVLCSSGDLLFHLMGF